MPGIKLFTSNRLEILADLLAGVVRDPLASPLVAETVVVQSRGMERWVSMELSKRLGVWANCWFPFPNAFIKQVFASSLGDEESFEVWSPEVLTWRIMGLLPELLGNTPFTPLRNYLSFKASRQPDWEAEPTNLDANASADELKLFQLARRIADVFDQYSIFRPEMLIAWEKTKQTPPDHGDQGDQQWQAELWQALAGQTNCRHRARIRTDFLDSAQRNRIDPEQCGLNGRINVFGISELPRFHLEVLSALAEQIDVNLFVMNPCKGYWSDIVPRKVIAKKAASSAQMLGQHLEEGNSLLASMGKAAGDFFNILADMGVEHEGVFVDPRVQENENSLLAAIQSDILHLCRRGAEDAPRLPMGANDESIRIHSCHGPMREVEVLHDSLLDLFQRFPAVAPRDVVVMAPNIEEYAPFIQAVFSSSGDPTRAISFSIADRTAGKGSEIIAAFLAALELSAGRFGAAGVLDLLECQAIKDKFQFSDREVETVRRWVCDAGIRWGVDAEHRRELGLPGFPENTWEAGVERLLLGYAMADEGDNLFAGRLPFNAVEGAEASAVLEKFTAFYDSLVSGLRSLHKPRPLSRWEEKLTSLFDNLFLPSEHEETEARMIRQALLGLSEIETLSGFDRPVDMAAVRAQLGSSLGGAALGGGFLSAGVTFCAMIPMRGIPFRVICLLGMNDTAFPRRERPPGFDLMRKMPRPGDRSLRNEDRYIFLEALLSARDRLHISYVGQSLRDGSALPPSVLVSELLDAVDQGFSLPEGNKKPTEAITVKHRLQAFSPAYFAEGKKLFSYSEENLRASRLLLPDAVKKKRGLFVEAPLPPPDEDFRNLDLQELMGFFSNPCKYLLRKRLGFSIDDRDETVEEREFFEISGLEKYILEQKLLNRSLEGKTPENAIAALNAAGEIPHGASGQAGFASLVRETNLFLRKIEPHLQSAPLEAASFEMALGRFRLSATLTGLRTNGLVIFRPARRLKAKDYLKGWLQHLALNLADDALHAGLHRETIIIAKDNELFLPSLDNAETGAEAIMLDLLEIYWQGLSEALPFFPESSFAYAKTMRGKEPSRQKALNAARAKWEGNWHSDAECDDPHHALCFGDEDPFNERFEELAEKIFGPVPDL